MTGTQRSILVVVLVPVFMSLLSTSSNNVVLPALQTSLAAPTSQIQWVLSGSTLASAGSLAAGGRAGDTRGRGTRFVAGLAHRGRGPPIDALGLTRPLLSA